MGFRATWGAPAGRGSPTVTISPATTFSVGLNLNATLGGGAHTGLRWQRDDAYGLNPTPGTFADIGGPRCSGENLAFVNWGGRGISIVADIHQGTNANECHFNKVQLILCGNALTQQDGRNAGVYLDGGDSNGCMFLACDATDCRRGFYDSSFLGNSFIGCSVEGCNDRFTKNPQDPTVGYGFITDDPNARSTFVGCYVESDSESDVNYPAFVIGGLFQGRGNATAIGAGGAGPTFAGSGAPYVDPISGEVLQTATTMGGQPGTPSCALAFSVVNRTTGIPPQQPTRLLWGLRAAIPDWWRLNYAGLDDYDILRWRQRELWFPNGYMRGYPAGGDSRGMREDTAADINFASPSDGGTWVVGDRVTILQPAAGQPSVYRCTAVIAGVPTWKVEARLDP